MAHSIYYTPGPYVIGQEVVVTHSGGASNPRHYFDWRVTKVTKTQVTVSRNIQRRRQQTEAEVAAGAPIETELVNERHRFVIGGYEVGEKSVLYQQYYIDKETPEVLRAYEKTRQRILSARRNLQEAGIDARQ